MDLFRGSLPLCYTKRCIRSSLLPSLLDIKRWQDAPVTISKPFDLVQRSE